MKLYNSQRGAAAFILLILVAVILMFLIWWVRSPSFPLRQQGPTPEDELALIAKGAKYTIEITNKGFVPGVVTVAPYDTVTFVNRDVAAHQPADGDLEGEGGCEEFGAPDPLIQNQTYQIVFKEEIECAFHDALSETFTAGTIFVQKSNRE